MANMIKRESYGNKKNILLDPHAAYVIEVQVNNTGHLPAGTILGGSTNALMNRQAVLSEVSGATAQGVLLNDLNDGDTNGVMVVRGVIDSSKIANFSTKVPAEAQTALKHIIFRNGEYA